MHLQEHSTFTLTIGEPVRWQSITGERSHTEWAQHIRENVYRLSSETELKANAVV